MNKEKKNELFEEGGDMAALPQTELEPGLETEALESGTAEGSAFLQTETENALDDSNAIADPGEGDADDPSHQTEMESAEDLLANAPGSGPALQTETENQQEAEFVDPGTAEENKDGLSHQTDLESAKNLLASTPENSPAPQTDLETGETSAEESSPAAESGAQAALHQTETEPAKKPRRRRKTESVPPQSGQDQTQSDTEQAADEQETVEEGTVKEPASRKRRTAARRTQVLSIDERPTVETDEDKARNDLLDLLESQKSGRILTGTIQGVERPVSNPSHSYAVIYHGDIKVIIPAEETVEPPADYRGMLPQDVLHYMLTKRLGAEVDYIVRGIDPDSGIAAASRLDAMRAKRRQYYLGTDRDGRDLIYPGVCAEARVVSVIRAGIFVDLFGVEAYIPLRELSYQRWMDAAGHFQPGQRILVKVLELNRSDRNNIQVTASVKQASENPYERALRRYTTGSCYVGTVSMVDTNGVFVALDGGIDCLCSYPKRGRPPRGSRVTVRILGINHEANRIWGAITHIAMPR